MRVTVLTSEPSSQAPTLRENGLAVRIDRTENLGAEKSVVLAIDRSQSMRGAPLAHAIAAARSFVASKPAADRVAVASFATKPQLLTDFSTERSDSDGALGSIQVDPVQGTTLYDAVVKSSNVLANEPLEARVIIVVTDGNETRSSASLDDAIAAARKAGASIYVVAIESPKFNPAPLHKLAEETGGVYHGTSSSATLSAQYAAIAAELKRTWMLDYATTARPGDTAFLEATWKGEKSTPKSITLPASLGPGSADPKPSHLLPAVFYKSVLGTQVMAIVSFFIVLLAASLAMTTVKGARLKKRIGPHLAPDGRQEAQAGAGAARSRGRAVQRDRERLRGLEALEAARPARGAQRPARPHGRDLLRHVRRRADRRPPGHDADAVDADHARRVRRRRHGAGRVRLVQGEPAAERLREPAAGRPDHARRGAQGRPQLQGRPADDRRRGQPAREQGVPPGSHRGTPREAAGGSSLRTCPSGSARRTSTS